MGQVSLTTLANGTVADADQVMSDLFAIVNEVNGNLTAITNVQVASAGTVTGYQNTTGNSSALAASDHQHIVQGVERTTGDPAFGNFDGRLFFNTATHKLRMVSDSSGPTFKTVGNLSGDELVGHAANHTDGGVDQLADNAIAERSLKSRTIVSGEQTSAITGISTSGYTTVQEITVTTTGIQTLLVVVHLRPINSSASNRLVAFRVKDQTVSGTPTIFKSIQHQMGATNGGSDSPWLHASFFYTVPAAGTRTLRLSAGADGSGVNISAAGSFNSEATTGITPMLSAAVI